MGGKRLMVHYMVINVQIKFRVFRAFRVQKERACRGTSSAYLLFLNHSRFIPVSFEVIQPK